jgi:hypothetical protein
MTEEQQFKTRRLVFAYAEYKTYVSSMYSRGGEIEWLKLHKGQIAKYIHRLTRLRHAQELAGVKVIADDILDKRIADAVAILNGTKEGLK